MRRTARELPSADRALRAAGWAATSAEAVPPGARRRGVRRGVAGSAASGPVPGGRMPGAGHRTGRRAVRPRTDNRKRRAPTGGRSRITGS
ncbi:hypothetical protein STSU_006730 [Streptomyces tsukubensis NRRL18488]|uniref:Uncharacterized protein n=1 Tax=Streptomyces tsukubensis (strain DSM 42081 / NBRC 108919 / NRRL 18488 / 9993) TaxID=1114943 RepID=A0A7G3U921_STRT9|nr:hypothetical protein STSU_006730 [Streptomyces tsukubensis NRRL18488]